MDIFCLLKHISPSTEFKISFYRWNPICLKINSIRISLCYYSFTLLTFSLCKCIAPNIPPTTSKINIFNNIPNKNNFLMCLVLSIELTSLACSTESTVQAQKKCIKNNTNSTYTNSNHKFIHIFLLNKKIFVLVFFLPSNAATDYFPKTSFITIFLSELILSKIISSFLSSYLYS